MPQRDDSTITVFAVAPAPGNDNDHCPEKVLTAHERDMVSLRDMIKEDRYNHAVPTSGNIEDLSMIEPSNGVLEMLQKSPNASASKRARVHGGDEKPAANSSSTHRAVGRSMNRFNKKKTTTAANFFAGHSKKKEETKKQNADTSKSTPSPSSAVKAETNSLSSGGLNPARHEKENKINNRGSSSKSNDSDGKVGNADDFVGDMDDGSDDEDVVEVNPPESFKLDGARSISRDAPIEPEDDPAVDASPANEIPKTNATGKITLDPNRKRKRRKKLIEKTTMQNGYLHTETQAVWEDVPTDEEEEEEQAAADRRAMASKASSSLGSNKASGKSSKAPAQRATKQQSLMGFFGKKK